MKAPGAVTSDAWERTGTRGMNDSQGSDDWGWVYSRGNILPYFKWENGFKDLPIRKKKKKKPHKKLCTKAEVLYLFVLLIYLYFYWSKVGLQCCVRLWYTANWFSVYICVCVCMCVQSCLTLCDPVDCYLPGSSVHGISQKRTLEWIAVSYSRGLSRPRDQSHISCLASRFFTTEPFGKTIYTYIYICLYILFQILFPL